MTNISQHTATRKTCTSRKQASEQASGEAEKKNCRATRLSTTPPPTPLCSYREGLGQVPIGTKQTALSHDIDTNTQSKMQGQNLISHEDFKKRKKKKDEKKKRQLSSGTIKYRQILQTRTSTAAAHTHTKKTNPALNQRQKYQPIPPQKNL